MLPKHKPLGANFVKSRKNNIHKVTTEPETMKKVPDLVFVIDTNYESLAIKESIKLGIPIIAILDTNSNPDGIDFPIPGNDDARRSIDLYCNLIKETILNAKKEAPNNNEDNEEKKNKNNKDKKTEEKKSLKKIN